MNSLRNRTSAQVAPSGGKQQVWLGAALAVTALGAVVGLATMGNRAPAVGPAHRPPTRTGGKNVAKTDHPSTAKQSPATAASGTVHETAAPKPSSISLAEQLREASYQAEIRARQARESNAK